jgi:hypothetical protein
MTIRHQQGAQIQLRLRLLYSTEHHYYSELMMMPDSGQVRDVPCGAVSVADRPYVGRYYSSNGATNTTIDPAGQQGTRTVFLRRNPDK